MLNVIILKNVICNIFNFFFSIKLLMFTRFLMGFYHNFSEKLILKRISILYCVSANTLLIIFVLINGFSQSGLMFYCTLFDHFLLILLSIYTEEAYFTDYMTEIQRIGASTGLKSYGVTWVSRIFSCAIYYRLFSLFFFVKDMVRRLPFALLLVCCHDLSFVPVILMLELFRYRIKCLKVFGERNLQNLHLPQGNIRSKLRKIKKLIHVYKNLYNNIESNFSIIKFLLAVKFATNFRQIMQVAYITLDNTISKKSLTGVVDGIIWEMAMTNAITLLAPVLVELAANELDKIKIILADQLLFCTETEVREALQDALAYLRVRPFRCVVWRAVSIDASAPLAFIALVTNYLTVMIQFMKPHIDAEIIE